VFLSSPLKDQHNLAQFDCGEPSLNVWLAEHARRAQLAGTSRTYVWTSEDSDDVVAYYSIAPTQVERAELTGGQAGGFSIVPAYLLTRFALDRSIQGQGLSDDLLLDAVEVITRAASAAGGRLIVVDAINSRVAAYYHRRGFHPIKGDSLRLVMKVETAKRALSTGRMTVSAQSGLGLAGIVLSTPRGVAASVVASPDELRAIASELESRADAAEPFTMDSLREAIKTALGRDPFKGA
jgi:predicted GNAT family N-acyltransferase